MNQKYEPTNNDIKVAKLCAGLLYELKPVQNCEIIEVEISGNLIEIPVIAFDALREVMYQMASGNTVVVDKFDEILTTSQAAKELGVTRPFLVKLLESGVIPFSLVGKHRRVKYSDLMEYKDEVNTKAVANGTVFMQKTFDYLEKKMVRRKN